MLKLLLWASVCLVVYVYIGYPVLVYLLSHLRKGAQEVPPAPAKWPQVTIIVPAHNEERWIARKIENALALDYPPDRLQILIASDGCTDNTVAIAGRYFERGVNVNHQVQRSGKMATLNRVIPEARGDIILITDCNAMLSPDALQLLVRHFCDPSVGCVTGEKVCLRSESSASEGEGFYWRYEGWIKSSENRFYSCLGGYGQILAVRRSLFPHIPGASDDFYVPMRILISAGKRVVFEPRAKAQIPAARTLGQELQRKIRTHLALFQNADHLRDGLKPWKSRVWWQLWSHHIMRLLVPFAMLISLASSALLWEDSRLFRIMTIAQCSFYLAAIAGYLLTRRGFRFRVLYVPFYFAFANLGVLLAWVRWIQGMNPNTWRRTERMLPT